MHFLFGTGVGLIVFWLVCAWLIERVNVRTAAKMGLTKDEYYKRQLELWRR